MQTIDLLIVSVVVIAIVWLITRTMNAWYEQKRAIAAKFAAQARLKRKKKAGSEEEDEEPGSLVDALLLELGVPPAMAVPVIQGMIQNWMNKGKPPGPGTEGNYT